MSYETILTILIIGVACFIVNIPFGMLRSRVNSYSLLWFICIHAPIPVSALMRRAAGLSWWYISIFLLFSIVGQVIGKKAALKYFPQK